jgi:uncharacterized phage-like protein YoqJ
MGVHMRTLISGHRLFKLKNYSIEYIKLAIDECIDEIVQKYGIMVGYSGMASGVDLWFCQSCLDRSLPYHACIPFEFQENLVESNEFEIRRKLIAEASRIDYMRNSMMVNKVKYGIIVWDGNKGGTHNVFQQMIENGKEFHWINPVSEKIIKV